LLFYQTRVARTAVRNPANDLAVEGPRFSAVHSNRLLASLCSRTISFSVDAQALH
jgi:hypothetical protein